MFNLKKFNNKITFENIQWFLQWNIHEWLSLFTSTRESFLKIGLSWILQDVTPNEFRTETSIK